MEVPGQLVAALWPHGLVLCVVEGVEREMLDLVVILLEEEVIGQVVEHHRVPAVDGVGLTQFLHTWPVMLSVEEPQVQPDNNRIVDKHQI